MKTKKYLKLLALSTMVIGTVCAVSLQSNNHSLVSKTANSVIENTITPPDPLANEKLMKEYFTPTYSSATQSFFDSKDTFPNSLFPHLWKNDKDGKLSITFRQLFIDEKIATTLSKSADQHFTADSPVLQIEDKKTIKHNYLQNIKKISLSALLDVKGSTSNSPEEFLSEVFLNPWIYSSDEAAGGIPANAGASFDSVTSIELSKDKLTSIPVGTFAKLLKNKKASNGVDANKLSIELDDNYLSILSKESFGPQESAIDNLSININNNRFAADFWDAFKDSMTKDWGTSTTQFDYEDKREDSEDTHAYFEPINPYDKYFVTSFVENNFPIKQRWTKSLTGKYEFTKKLCDQINTLNLYSGYLDPTSENIKITSNNFTGKFIVDIKSTSEEHTTYSETQYLNTSAIPLIFYIVIFIAGVWFLENRIAKMVPHKAKKAKK